MGNTRSRLWPPWPKSMKRAWMICHRSWLAIIHAVTRPLASDQTVRVLVLGFDELTDSPKRNAMLAGVFLPCRIEITSDTRESVKWLLKPHSASGTSTWWPQSLLLGSKDNLTLASFSYRDNLRHQWPLSPRPIICLNSIQRLTRTWTSGILSTYPGQQLVVLGKWAFSMRWIGVVKFCILSYSGISVTVENEFPLITIIFVVAL